MAADLERSVLEFYQVSSLNPVEWPAEKNNSDDSDAEDMKKKINRRKSRYQALEKAVNRNSVIQGSENGGKGIVQRDEPDPLGSTDSVVRTLKALGLPLQDDIRLSKQESSSQDEALLLTPCCRKSLSSILDDVLPCPVSVADACNCRHCIITTRPRDSISEY
jgi:hypothetical protein